MKEARPTILDVAKRAGVDSAVVSKVLSGDPNLRVRDETRQRVREAAAELDYRPNFYARGLARSRAEAIGLLIPGGNPLMVPIVAGAEEAASARGLLLWTATHEGALTERYLRFLRSGAVDAALVTGLRYDVDVEPHLTDARIPTLLVNRRAKGADRWVVLDDRLAARMATEHLIERGHRLIAYAGGPEGIDTAERRQRGFEDAMSAAGLEVRPDWLASSTYTPDGGASSAATILAASDTPTAIVAADATLGLGVWHQLHASGLDVPGDVSLIAIHKLPAEDFRTPAMTCVQLPLHELGKRAVELVLDTSWDAHIRETVSGDLVLSEGATVAAPAGT